MSFLYFLAKGLSNRGGLTRPQASGLPSTTYPCTFRLTCDKRLVISRGAQHYSQNDVPNRSLPHYQRDAL